MSEDYCTYQDVVDDLKGMDLDAWTENEIIKYIDRYADSIDEKSASSWREIVVEDELHSMKINSVETMAVHLQHEPVKTITSLQIWNGNEYEEWIGTKTEGRADDWWCDYKHGIVYIRTSSYWQYGLDVKVSYTYGETKQVPADVWELNILYVVRKILTQMAHTVAVPEGGQNPVTARLAKVEDRINNLEWSIVGWQIVDEGSYP